MKAFLLVSQGPARNTFDQSLTIKQIHREETTQVLLTGLQNKAITRKVITKVQGQKYRQEQLTPEVHLQRVIVHPQETIHQRATVLHREVIVALQEAQAVHQEAIALLPEVVEVVQEAAGQLLQVQEVAVAGDRMIQKCRKYYSAHSLLV